MLALLISWKTTLAGISSLLIGLGNAGHAISEGRAPGADDIGIIVASLGLIFAKDQNVTGGKRQQ